ncbi:hypothetical protein HDU76_001001 [Blyttiomyces sp. JEL0837]|nr:hypothetical protein HDU76_001001 [Blyttiomyces sp. JEL0837]
MTGLAWLNYAVNQHDVFIYLQNIPALIVGFSITLQWHPYLRKRVRRGHETAAVVCLCLITLTTVGTSVSAFINANVSRIALGSLAGASTLVHAVCLLREIVRNVFGEDRPGISDFILAGVGILFGGVWTAYGFYGAQDPFIYWAGMSILHLLLLAYGAFRNGMEMGWDSGSEDDDDITVDRLNRASSIASRQRSVRSTRSNPAYEEDGHDRQSIQDARYPAEDDASMKA